MTTVIEIISAHLRTIGADGLVQPDAGRNEEGPRGTYGCACISRNAFACMELRYGYRDQQERCECVCHNWEDDDDDA